MCLWQAWEPGASAQANSLTDVTILGQSHSVMGVSFIICKVRITIINSFPPLVVNNVVVNILKVPTSIPSIYQLSFMSCLLELLLFLFQEDVQTMDKHYGENLFLSEYFFFLGNTWWGKKNGYLWWIWKVKYMTNHPQLQILFLQELFLSQK